MKVVPSYKLDWIYRQLKNTIEYGKEAREFIDHPNTPNESFSSVQESYQNTPDPYKCAYLTGVSSAVIGYMNMCMEHIREELDNYVEEEEGK